MPERKKTVVVTGMTSGIGYEVGKAFAVKGFHVIGIGRTQERCDAALAKLKNDVPIGDFVFFNSDLMQQSDVVRVAEKIKKHLGEGYDGALDVLVNNAGGVRSYYATTAEGYEQQFALNHLAGFLLTSKLMPELTRSGARVLITGSASHKHMRMRWDDIMFKKRYSCLFAYKQSKLCNMLFANEFNRRYSHLGVRAAVVDPGLVNTDIGNKMTGGVVSKFWSWRKRFGTPPQIPAKTYVYLWENPGEQGVFYYGCKERAQSKYAMDATDAGRLFELSEKLCNIQFGG